MNGHVDTCWAVFKTVLLKLSKSFEISLPTQETAIPDYITLSKLQAWVTLTADEMALILNFHRDLKCTSASLFLP